MEQANKVRGIAHQGNIAKVTVRGVPDRPGIAAHLFEPLAEAGVSVDTIVQNASVEALTDLTFTVARSDLDRAVEVVNSALPQIDAREVVSDPDLGSVSIVGTGMATTPGYAARMFRTLFDHGINIELISTSRDPHHLHRTRRPGRGSGQRAARGLRARPGGLSAHLTLVHGCGTMPLARAFA